MKYLALVGLLFVCLVPAAARADKAELYKSIDDRGDASWEAALKIWGWAEPGYQETRSAALLADLLKQAGFEVKTGVAEIPTAFTATIGSGKPVIGILGEYDALPGLSQTDQPQRQPRDETSYGHGCGHHLFGVGSASAAIAVAEQIKQGKIKGTLRYYGCPAEEGGAAKVFMVRAGLFNDCDVVLHWHPGSRNSAGDSTCLARIAVKFRFYGKSAHAAGQPEQGRSALDAVELTNHAAELLREHTPDFTRIHHVITYGGGAPNVVPDFAEVFYYIRHPKAEVVRKLYPRLLKCAEAGALATETRLDVQYLGGTMELLPNDALAQVVLKNLRALNNLEYNNDEVQFAARLQNTMPQPVPLDVIRTVTDRSGQLSKGSTDVGDVSWVVPTAGMGTSCWVPGTPGHSWQAVACGGTTIARKGMQLASKVLAASLYDVFQDAATVSAAKQELQNRLAGRKYEPLIDADLPPPLDYRKPPKLVEERRE